MEREANGKPLLISRGRGVAFTVLCGVRKVGK